MTPERLAAVKRWLSTLDEHQRQHMRTVYRSGGWEGVEDARVQLEERIGYHLDAGRSRGEAERAGWDAYISGAPVLREGRSTARGPASDVPARVDPGEQWRRIAARSE